MRHLAAPTVAHRLTQYRRLARLKQFDATRSSRVYSASLRPDARDLLGVRSSEPGIESLTCVPSLLVDLTDRRNLGEHPSGPMQVIGHVCWSAPQASRGRVEVHGVIQRLSSGDPRPDRGDARTPSSTGRPRWRGAIGRDPSTIHRELKRRGSAGRDMIAAAGAECWPSDWDDRMARPKTTHASNADASLTACGDRATGRCAGRRMWMCADLRRNDGAHAVPVRTIYGRVLVCTAPRAVGRIVTEVLLEATSRAAAGWRFCPVHSGTRDEAHPAGRVDLSDSGPWSRRVLRIAACPRHWDACDP